MGLNDIKDVDIHLLKQEMPRLRQLLAKSESSALQHTVAITMGLLILVWVLSDMVVVAGLGGFWKVPLILLWFLAAMWMMTHGLILVRERLLSKEVELMAGQLHQETLDEIGWDEAGGTYKDRLTKMINLPDQAEKMLAVYRRFMDLSGRWEQLAGSLTERGVMDEASARTFLAQLRELMTAEANLAASLS